MALSALKLRPAHGVLPLNEIAQILRTLDTVDVRRLMN
jgi:hypothetical protein